MRNITKGIMALSLALALVAVGASAVSAETYEPVNSSDTPISETITVSNQTQEVRLVAENVSNGTLEVTVYSKNKSGLGALVQETTGTLSTDQANGTYKDTFTFDSSQFVSGTDTYKIQVNGSTSTTEADLLDVSKLQLVGAGGGSGSGSGVLSSVWSDMTRTEKLGSIGVVAAVVGVGAFTYVREM